MLSLKKGKMNSVIYPAGLKIYFQKNEINSVADYKNIER